MGIAMSISVFQRGGLFFESGNYLILILGTLASEMDTLMRLVYQKYKSTEKELIEKGIIKEVKGDRKDQEQVSSLKVRIEMEFGIGGILPIAILLATIFNFLDIVIVYCFVYYGLSAVAMILNYIIKARKTEKAFKGDF